tara:strand:- start:1646 stop:2509 length:864 start_codon:yes stop_codon:yes gene_type:complete
MKDHYLGNIKISKVLEYVEQQTPEFVLRNFEKKVIEENSDWLFPNFMDKNTNNFIFSFHSYLLRTGKTNILIDTCVGNDKPRPLENWNMRKGNYIKNLNAQNIHPSEIDYVMCTHLHADHVGWNTKLNNGKWVPTFPNAKYIFSKIDYEFFNNVKENQPGYQSMKDSVSPIVDAGQASLVSNDIDFTNEISLIPSPGHTPGHYCINIKSENKHAILSGDLIHHPVQIARPDWKTNFCNDPEHAAQTRIEFVNKYTNTGTMILAAHFAEPTAGTIVNNKNTNKFCPIF